MELTHVNRANTNEEVYGGANEEVGEAGTPIIPLSRVLQLKWMKLVGRIQKPRNHPQHQVTLLRERQYHGQLQKRSAGRPGSAGHTKLWK